HLDIMLKLNDQLNQDGRFHDLAWYDNNDVEDGRNGCPLPVIGQLPPGARSSENQRKRSIIGNLLTPIPRRPPLSPHSPPPERPPYEPIHGAQHGKALRTTWGGGDAGIRTLDTLPSVTI